MCHTVVAQRMCQVCRLSQGETVIDFTRCARKCYSPFYRLTPTPQMVICSVCSAGSPGGMVVTTPATATADSSPVMSRNSSIDASGSDSVCAAAAAAAASAVSPVATTTPIPALPDVGNRRRLS